MLITFAFQVFQEEVRREIIRTKDKAHGPRGETAGSTSPAWEHWGVGACLLLQELDPLGQRRFAGAQSPLSSLVPGFEIRATALIPQGQISPSFHCYTSLLTNHFNLCLLIITYIII